MIQVLLHSVRDAVWSLPFLGFIVFAGCIMTIALKFIQFTHFFASWRSALGGSDTEQNDTQSDMSPFQAFLSALSVSIGNGCLAGIATALYLGGPGATLWIFVIGLLGMALRFAEVFLGVTFALFNKKSGHTKLGGPFLYIDTLPLGKVLAVTYAAACLFYGVASGNAMQCNSISTALHNVTGLPTLIIGLLLACFMLYVMLGGAKRIVKVTDAIVPVKVGLFFSTMIFVLLYYWSGIIPAISLIIESAFSPAAATGGVVGIGVQKLFAISASRTINASESGLGTAAIFYGNTGSTKPYHDGLSGMLSTFISNNVVSVLVALALTVSGAWNSGLDGAAMVVFAYQSVFGVIGGWIVALLSITFGLGVFVAYGYVTRQCWLYLTNGRFESIFIALFAVIAFIGSVTEIQMVWAAVDLGVAACLTINVVALLYLIPVMRKQMKAQA